MKKGRNCRIGEFLTNLYKIRFGVRAKFVIAPDRNRPVKPKIMTFEELKSKVIDILKHANVLREDKLLQVCHLLRDNIDYYDWVGFYFRNGEKEELILGPYAGEPTDHTVIPFGKGICGQVAVSNETFVVPDVTAQDNYIACSLTVKSEIVVPLFVEGKNIGQIDIDSEVLDAFTDLDQRFLEEVNVLIAKFCFS